MIKFVYFYIFVKYVKLIVCKYKVVTIRRWKVNVFETDVSTNYYDMH